MAKIPGATHHAGKGSIQEMLPHRSALTTIAGGRANIGSYAKVTPSGAGALGANSIMGMSKPNTDGTDY
jgi:hypothetical protein